MRALLLRVGDDAYAVPMELAREVVAAPVVTVLPTSPASVLGVCNVRGEIMPVFDTGLLLGLGPIPACTAMAIVETSMGTMTIDDYLIPLGRDAVIHAWDIARATHTDERLDPLLVEATLAHLEPSQMAAGRGTYGERLELHPGATMQDRLLAATGRDPR